jgi:hypothetical protein
MMGEYHAQLPNHSTAIKFINTVPVLKT